MKNSGALKDNESDSIQDFNKTPVFFGADVCTLYPSRDILGTADLASKSILESKVKLEGIKVKMLAIYLFLVLGRRSMHKLGLAKLIPNRLNKKTQAASLSASINRNTENWSLSNEKISEETLRVMMAALIKILTIVLMKSTCYTVGGVIFKQLMGAGIGLRASACLAKLIMGQLDKRWAYIQLICGFLCTQSREVGHGRKRGGNMMSTMMIIEMISEEHRKKLIRALIR